MSGVWELPTHNIQSKGLKRAVDGFQLSAIVALVDGRPYSGTISGNPRSPSPLGTNSGPLGIGGSSRFPGVGRNIFTSPGANSVDMTQYVFSGITLFPQSSFGTRSASGTNLFGPRQVQLGTRITF